MWNSREFYKELKKQRKFVQIKRFSAAATADVVSAVKTSIYYDCAAIVRFACFFFAVVVFIAIKFNGGLMAAANQIRIGVIEKWTKN